MTGLLRNSDILTCDKCEHTFLFSEGIVFEGFNIFDEREAVKICSNCLKELGSNKEIIEYIDKQIEFILLSGSIYLMGNPTQWRSKLFAPVMFI